MRNSHASTRRSSRWLLPLGCLVVLGYFGLQAFVGDRGILSHRRIEAENARLRGELVDLRTQSTGLEAQIALLNSDKLDPDMLDERVRAILNFADPADMVILRQNR